jgi:hypothetical protein
MQMTSDGCVRVNPLAIDPLSHRSPVSVRPCRPVNCPSGKEVELMAEEPVVGDYGALIQDGPIPVSAAAFAAPSVVAVVLAAIAAIVA